MKSWVIVLVIYAAPPNAVDWPGPWQKGRLLLAKTFIPRKAYAAMKRFSGLPGSMPPECSPLSGSSVSRSRTVCPLARHGDEQAC